jgi:hypothetical protein
VPVVDEQVPGFAAEVKPQDVDGSLLSEPLLKSPEALQAPRRMAERLSVLLVGANQDIGGGVIQGSRYLEVDGVDSGPWFTEPDRIPTGIEEFLTGRSTGI